MLWKTLKLSAIGLGDAALIGGLVFGREIISYARTSTRQVRSAVKDNVPLEFELARAKDLIDEILPEMHANIKLIAEEEVEIASLRDDIRASDQAMDEQTGKVARLREMLGTSREVFVLAGRQYQRAEMTEELSRRFEQCREAQMVLAGKNRLLETRERNLASAIRVLQKTRSDKTLLEQKVAALEGQYRLVRASQAGSAFQFDATKSSRAQRLLTQIKKRLDVAERVLAHEAKFVEAIPLPERVDEQELLLQVDDFLTGGTDADGATLSSAAGPAMPSANRLDDVLRDAPSPPASPALSVN